MLLKKRRRRPKRLIKDLNIKQNQLNFLNLEVQ